ncbi:alpha/beta hydrolase [Brevibacterium samyangense]
MESTWRDDELLGAPYESRALPLEQVTPMEAEQEQGTPGSVGSRSGEESLPTVEEQATLVAYRGPVAGIGPAAGLTVLFVHGWSDYFFHTKVAEFWARLGAHFYALDLRGYGRSLLAKGFDGNGRALEDGPLAGTGLTTRPGYIENLDEYDEEIGLALEVIAGEHPEARLVLEGHSTGGLVLSLWAHRHPGRAAALVLNSPWLEFQFSTTARKILRPLLGLGGLGSKQAWRTPLPMQMPNFYTLAVATAMGRPPYDLRLKPAGSFPVYPGWLSAVFDGHAQVEEGLAIGAPVLVQTSTVSYRNAAYRPVMSTADIVLDVDAIARRALSLGPLVTIQRLPGALHDIHLSSAPVALAALEGIEKFVRGFVAQ